MQYRTIPKSGVKLSCIGFGGMRIPTGRGVSEKQAIATVRRAIDLGVNYIETAPGYGDSEILIGKAIKDGYRERAYVSTKSHTRSAAEMRSALEKSLERLQVERLDFYHMWYICSADDWKHVMKKGGPLEGARKAQSERLIDHIGITTHAPISVVKEMVDCGEYELVTISCNAANREYEEIIDYAGERDVGVVIMNPLAGGMLARPPRGAKNQLRPRPHIMAALGFLLANPHVTTAICGAKSPEEMEEDVAAGEFLPSGAAAAARGADLAETEEDFCTTCGYCMPCEFGVNIPQAMLNWNYRKLYGMDFSKWSKKARKQLREIVRFGECTECGACIERCPNSLPIIDRLRELENVIKSGT
ncbi:MAG: aldo/keto reductase [Planctomycetota bacterium]|jgi:predicted aldo/keto reductase-like oxidoreductase